MSSAELTFSYLPAERWEEWDVFVNRSPQGTIFQSSRFIRCVTDTFHRPAKTAVVFRQDSILGGCVLYPLQRVGLRYSTTPYFIPYNGLLLDPFSESPFYFKRNSRQNRVSELLLKNIEKDYAFCQFRQSPNLEDLRHFIWRKWKVQPEYSVVLRLDGNRNLLDSMENAQRRRFRQIESRGCRVEPTDQADLIFRQMSGSYQSHGMKPPLERDVFERFVKNLLDNQIATIYAAELDKRIAATLLVVEDRPDLYALFSGRDFETDSSGTELFLIWKVAEMYAGQNYRKMDLLGAMIPSITKVKLEMGGQLQRSDVTLFFRNQFYRAMFDGFSALQQKRRFL
ncbi:MAG TPA: GNAT family N-acetyltransferase [Caldithrix sp.]|nr:GNAT family N-acetyltransferase [Caldithrix sp.]